jgi:tRNA threonylcarbamoyl adenosine modification protein YeaZ
VIVLAFDTSTPAVTVAIAAGRDVLAERTVIDARRHGELLAPGIDGVLNAARLDRRELTDIVVGVGPGPFTGLRVGVMTALALANVLGISIHGMCSLDAVAFESGLAGEMRVATDARRKEVFWAQYQDGRRISGPNVGRPAELAWDGPVAGEGAVLYPSVFPRAAAPRFPSAAAMCRNFAQGAIILAPRPLYLRRPDAAPARGRKSVLP